MFVWRCWFWKSSVRWLGWWVFFAWILKRGSQVRGEVWESLLLLIFARVPWVGYLGPSGMFGGFSRRNVVQFFQADKKNDQNNLPPWFPSQIELKIFLIVCVCVFFLAMDLDSNFHFTLEAYRHKLNRHHNSATWIPYQPESPDILLNLSSLSKTWSTWTFKDLSRIFNGEMIPSYQGLKQPLMLGIHRSDYMLHEANQRFLSLGWCWRVGLRDLLFGHGSKRCHPWEPPVLVYWFFTNSVFRYTFLTHSHLGRIDWKMLGSGR